MKTTFRFIIGVIVFVLISIHILVVGLFICPVHKLLNVALAHDVEYVDISNIPEHVRQVFSDDQAISLLENGNPINQIAFKILIVRQQKFFNDDERQELYLNTLDFGGNVIGIQSASNYYFQKPIWDLSFEETITLAGLYKIFDK